MSIITIDCNYIYPEIAAAFLMVEGNEATFIENNTSKSVPFLLRELEKTNISRENVKYIIITHVHLDHAGGTSELLKHCPNAIVLAHPKAAPHLINPERLINSSKQVYGEEKFNELYGTIEPIPTEKVRVVNDREKIFWGDRELTFIYTRGHANHHFVIHDSVTNSVFTGDSFGMGYKNLQKLNRYFLFPSTTPTDFHYQEAIISIEKIINTGAKRAYLTHFGEWDKMEEGAIQLKDMLAQMEELRKRAVDSDFSDLEMMNFMRDGMKQILESEGRKSGLEEADLEFLKFDIEINSMGLVFSAKRERKKN
jgi:glyoxylase-like metal-dependent hydrolase (beta-lactamase superfamily II)